MNVQPLPKPLPGPFPKPLPDPGPVPRPEPNPGPYPEPTPDPFPDLPPTPQPEPSPEPTNRLSVLAVVRRVGDLNSRTGVKHAGDSHTVIHCATTSGELLSYECQVYTGIVKLTRGLDR